VKTVRDHLTRLGKRSGEILRYLHASGGSSSVVALMDIFAGKTTRHRDFVSRVLGPVAGKGGTPAIVAVEGDVVRLRHDWREQLEKAREAGEEQEAEHRQIVDYELKKVAFRNRDQHPADRAPTQQDMDAAREERERREREDQQDRAHYEKHLTEKEAEREADGRVEDLERVEDQEKNVSDLAVAVREYLDRNPHDANEPAGWIANTLWCLGLFPIEPGAPGREAVKAALKELAAVEVAA